MFTIRKILVLSIISSHKMMANILYFKLLNFIFFRHIVFLKKKKKEKFDVISLQNRTKPKTDNGAL